MKSKKLAIIIIVVAFTALTINVFGQGITYPFQVKKTGTGSKSIIFIPGFACSGDVWNDTKSSYEKNYTCYTLTMAGFAGAPVHGTQTFRDWEDGIARFIEQNNIAKPIIIGHSMGGGLAMALAADYPAVIGKLVVVDALPCLAAAMNPAFKSNDNNDCSPMVSKMTALTNDEFYKMQKQSMARLLADTSKADMVIDWSVKSDRKTFAEMYCDFSNTDLREKISTIQCPSLILLEAYFANIKPAITEQFKNLKAARLQYATKGLHFIMFDDKDWYDAQLKSFLK